MASMFEVSLDSESKELIFVNADQIRYVRKHPHGHGSIIHFDKDHTISVATTASDIYNRILVRK